MDGSKDTEIVNEIMNAKSYCEILNINPISANCRHTVEHAYKLLALKVHPDKNSDINAKYAFDRIKQAYTYLIEYKHDLKFDIPSEKPKETRRKCSVTGNGMTCQSFAEENSQYCFAHESYESYKPANRCSGKYNGKDCPFFAAGNSQYCFLHIFKSSESFSNKYKEESFKILYKYT